MQLRTLRSHWPLWGSLFLLLLSTLRSPSSARRPSGVSTKLPWSYGVPSFAKGGDVAPELPAGGADTAGASSPGAERPGRRLSSNSRRFSNQGGEERKDASGRPRPFRHFRFPWQRQQRRSEDLRRFAKRVREYLGSLFGKFVAANQSKDRFSLAYPFFHERQNYGHKAVAEFAYRIGESSLSGTPSEGQLDPLDTILPLQQPKKVRGVLSGRGELVLRRAAVQVGSWYLLEKQVGPTLEMRVFSASKHTLDLDQLRKLEREVKDLCTILSRVRVPVPVYLEQYFHWHVPLDLVTIPMAGKLLDATPEIGVVNTMLIFRRRHGTIEDIKEMMKFAARSIYQRSSGLMALMSVTVQLLQLIAIYNSRGFFLKRVTPQNIVLTGSGVVLLTGFSPVLERGVIYYETETGDVVSEAPTRTARGFLPDAHHNGG